jgi:predicted phage gp36 major capsid-like protein
MTQVAIKETNHAEANAKAWYAEIVEMLKELKSANDDREYPISREENDRIDAARQRIHESVLSVEVRDGWRAPGGEIGPNGNAEEYQILLTTGGPALRLYGQLGQYGEPETAELQYQDWGTPWTRYPSPQGDLLRFAQCFYFGE